MRKLTGLYETLTSKQFVRNTINTFTVYTSYELYKNVVIYIKRDTFISLPISYLRHNLFSRNRLRHKNYEMTIR